MKKSWPIGGVIILFLGVIFFYRLPAVASTSTCPEGSKCIFNDTGPLLIQSQGGNIDLRATSSDKYIYLNYINAGSYGLGVSASGLLYHNGNSIVVADGGYYSINIDGLSKGLKGYFGEWSPDTILQAPDQQLFLGSLSPSYWGVDNPEDSVTGVSSIYSLSKTKPPLVSQLALVRDYAPKEGMLRQYLQYRFNDINHPNDWGEWVEVCDSSNNCHNFLNLLDGSSNNSLLLYQDPDMLVDSSLKVNDPSSLANCSSLYTSGGVISCGSGGGGGGISGSGTTNYLPRWSDASTLADSILYQNSTNIGLGTASPFTNFHIYDASSGPIITLSGLNNNYRGLTIKNTSSAEQWFVGSNDNNNFVIRQGGSTNLLTASSSGNVGIGSTSPGSKLSVEGTGYFTNTVTVAAPTASGHAATKDYVDTREIAWNKITGFPTACTSGQVVTGMNSTSLTCITPPSGVTYTAGNGLSLNGTIFSLAASGTSSYLAKWTGTSTLGTSSIYIKDDGNVGIGTTSPGSKLSVEGIGYFTNVVTVGTPTASGHAATKDYVDTREIAWNKITGFPTACTSGQVVTGMNSTSLTCITPPSGVTYTAGNGLSLNGTIFSLAASGTSSYLAKWTGTSTLGTSSIYIKDDGNVGIGTTSPGSKLSVEGIGYFTNVVTVGTPTASGHAATKDYVDTREIAWNKITGFPNACTSGQVVTGMNSTSLTCITPPSGVTYTAGNGLSLNGTIFSLAASGTSSYLAKWTGTSTLGTSSIYIKDDGNVGIGTTSPGSKLSVEGIGYFTNVVTVGTPTASGHAATKDYVDTREIAWNKITGFPNACTSGQVVTGMNSTSLTCITPPSGVTYTAGNGLSLNGTIFSLAASGTSSYLAKWTGTSTLGTSSIYIKDDGNVGIGTTSPGSKLSVEGIGYFTNVVTVGTPTASGHAATKDYVDTREIAWNKITGFPNACTSGQVVTGMNSTSLTCITPPSGVTYTAGNGLSLNDKEFSVLLDGTTLTSTKEYGLKVNTIRTDQITNGTIINDDISSSAGISDSKLATISTADKVSGSAVQLASGGGLTNSNGLKVADNTFAKLAGVNGGQTLIGGTAANNALILRGNSATSGNTPLAGSIYFKVGDTATTAVIILNNGNVGIGTTSPGSKLSVEGIGYFTNVVTVGTPTASGHAATKDYVDTREIAWNKITGFPNACTSGQVVTGMNSTSLTCITPPSGVTYTAGNGLSLNGTIFSLAASGTSSYLAKWTGTSTLGTSSIYIKDDGNVGIGTTSPGSKLSVEGIGYFTNVVTVGTPTASGHAATKDYVDTREIAWNKITGFPNACTSGQVVTGMNSTSLTCITPPSGVTYTAGNGLSLNDKEFSVLLDGTTLTSTKEYGLKVNTIRTDQITNGTIINDDISSSAGISDSKLATISTADKVSGSAVQLASGGGLTNSNGLKVADNTFAKLAGVNGGQTLIGGTAANNALILRGNSATSGNTPLAGSIYFKVGDTATTAVIILNNGNVGIGTATSDAKLDVNGNLTVRGTSSVDFGLITSDGYGNLSAQDIYGASGGPNGPTFSWSDDTNTGLFLKAADTVAFATNGTEKFSLDASGKAVFTNGSVNLMTIEYATGAKVTIGNGGDASKLDVGTVDPIYTIGGQRYATYMANMTGVKEETSGTITLDKQSAGLFMATLDFQNAPAGSDIWLFGRTTNIINNQEHFNQIACLLTPNFAGQTWYEKNWDGRSITVFARPDNVNRASVEVSYRLTAPRFDQKNWTNYSDSQHEGFNLDKLLQ